jgi:hypothetical protein
MLTIILFSSLAFAEPKVKAPAFSEKDKKYIEESFQSLGKVFSETAFNTPPCDAHKKRYEAILKYEPPKSCKRATDIFAKTKDFGKLMQASCEDLSKFMRAELTSKKSCQYSTLLKQLGERKIQITSEVEKKFSDYFEDIQTDEESGIPLPKGEFAEVKCAISVPLFLQYRKKEVSLMQFHFGRANAEMDDYCEDPTQYKGAYQEYLRHGEKD